MFVQTFGGTTIYPSDTTYLSLTVSANVTLAWPIEQAVSGNVVADIIDLNPTGPGFNVDFPDARQVSNGYTALFNNVGANTVAIRNAQGGTLVSLASGTVWQLYLIDNSTSGGSWRVFQYGASVSSSNASALAGAGLKAITTTLNEAIVTSSTASTPVNTVNADRAKLINWTGGVGVLNLPTAATVGADWFVIIRNSGSGNLTVTPPSGTIDGASTKIFGPDTSATVVTDGTNYWTIGFGGSSSSGGTSFDYLSINVAGSGNFTLSGSQLNRIGYQFTGVLTGNRSIIVPNTLQQYWVTNATTGAFSLFVKTVAQVTPIEILQGNAGILYCNGSDVVDAESSTVTFPISVALGGTGATTAANARVNLGVAYAAPTGLVGPTATTGATGNAMDAGSAPAINLTANYTWTGLQLVSSTDPEWRLNETDAAANNRLMRIAHLGEQFLMQFGSDAASFTTFAAFNRTLSVADDVTWTIGTNIFAGVVRPEANNTRDLGATGTLWANVFGAVYSLGTNKQALTDVSSVLTVGSGSSWTSVNIANATLTVNSVEVSLKAYTVNSQSANYTLVAGDAGDLILHPTGAGAGDTFTIPSNASVPFPVGTTLTFVNRDTSNAVSIAINTDTLIFSGSTSTGTRTLGINGIATALKIESTVWLISGVGLV